MTLFMRLVTGMLPMRSVPGLRKLARACWPKEQHATRGVAEAQMRSLLRRGLEKDASLLHPYRCPHCRLWHVGHGRAVAPTTDGGV